MQFISRFVDRIKQTSFFFLQDRERAEKRFTVIWIWKEEEVSLIFHIFLRYSIKMPAKLAASLQVATCEHACSSKNLIVSRTRM